MLHFFPPVLGGRGGGGKEQGGGGRKGVSKHTGTLHDFVVYMTVRRMSRSVQICW